MIRDFDDLCTWMYVLISDLFAPLAAHVARPGPAPACTDAELITMAIVGECCGWDQETVLLSRWREHRDLFPQQPERSRFNRRRRDLAPVINLLRQAFAIALDKTTLANTILHGTVQATNHIVPSGMPGYNPALVEPDGTPSLSGNTQMANQLATAYATDTKCGTATDFSKCPKVTLTISSGSQDAQNEAAAAQQMWLKAMPNYPISITSVDFNTLLQNLSAYQVQFWAIAWIEDYPDPQDWLTTNLACDSAYNAGLACDKTADQLMHAADANPDRTARLTQY